MLNFLRKLRYGARVFLNSRGGTPEVVDIAGRPTMILSGGDGPPFVYLHSSLGESARWLPFHAGFAKHFTTYAPSHPGFGQSGGFDAIRGIEDMAFHYVELLDALGLDEVVLGGVSLGGWIAAEVAVRWPERVKKLWLSGCPGLWVEEEPLPDLFRHLTDPAKLREMLFHDPKGAMATLVIPDEPDEEKRMAGYQAMTVLARLVWERPYSPALPARLHRVKCPVLLLWGEDDKLVPPSYGRAYAKLLPQAQWKAIPKCGHLGMFEKESEFVEAVRAFAS
ncbi:MAG: alpha/beta hydrolase [Gemmataceae bacterium]|nr:alpha/beta hydrolase [Gemmataceae bacterium]